MYKPHLGQKVNDLIVKSGDNKKEAAIKLGLSRNALYQTFKKEHISTEKLKKVANVYGVDIEYFFDTSEQKEVDENIELIQLKTENLLLKREIETLKDVIKLLKG